jgi:hypothetical protein
MNNFAKRFITIVACLVVVPCGIWWAMTGVFQFFVPPGTADGIAVGFFFAASLYFVPLVLIFPSLFESVAFMIRPVGLSGWITVVGAYSVLALVLALFSTAYSKWRQNRKSQNKKVDHISDSSRCQKMVT